MSDVRRIIQLQCRDCGAEFRAFSEEQAQVAMNHVCKPKCTCVWERKSLRGHDRITPDPNCAVHR